MPTPALSTTQALKLARLGSTIAIGHHHRVRFAGYGWLLTPSEQHERLVCWYDVVALMNESRKHGDTLQVWLEPQPVVATPPVPTPDALWAAVHAALDALTAHADESVACACFDEWADQFAGEEHLDRGSILGLPIR